jgi:hypothetical protein
VCVCVCVCARGIIFILRRTAYAKPVSYRFSYNRKKKCSLVSNALAYNTNGLYYKHITIVNDDSIMSLQVVASPTIIILTTLEVSFMLLAHIYSRGITHDDHHVMIVIYL